MLNRLSLRHVNASFNGCLSSKFILRSLGDSTKISYNNLVRKKINELIVWCEQVTGMDEVRLMQNRVIEAQDRFVAAQENRRKLALELISVHNKLNEIHAELITTSRGNERYLQLVTEEHKILKEERRMNSEFAICDRHERDSFSMLMFRFNERHVKEWAHMRRYKYLSFIGSVTLAILGIAVTWIKSKLQLRESNKLVRESATKNNTLQGDSRLIKILMNKEHTTLKAESINNNTVAGVSLLAVIVLCIFYFKCN